MPNIFKLLDFSNYLRLLSFPRKSDFTDIGKLGKIVAVNLHFGYLISKIDSSISYLFKVEIFYLEGKY
jgi:hypothetical protein